MPPKSKLLPHLDKLGTVPDKQLADLVGLSFEAVRRYRQRHGIPAHWRGEGEPQPGGETSPVPRRKTPSPRAKPTRKRRKSKLDPHLDKLGVLPDKEVAELAGVTPENVRAYRKRRGIPARWRGEGEPLPDDATPAPPAPKRASQPRKDKLTPYLAEIGILEDAVIARKAATTPQNVRNFRLRRGIPARWRGEGVPLAGEAEILQAAIEEPEPDLPPEPEEVLREPEEVLREPVSVPAKEEPAQPADARHTDAQQAEELPPEPEDALSPGPAKLALQNAYSVTVEGPEGETEYVAVGADIGDAALKALAALGVHGIEGTVVGIQFLTQALA